MLSKLVAIVYKSYDDRGIDIPHFRALITVILVIFLHAVQIGILLKLPSNYIMPWSSEVGKSIQWLYGALYFGIFIVVFAIVFRKSRLDKIEISQKQIDAGRRWIPIYLCFCIVFLVILLVKLGLEKGKI
jgi:hypothetical protein